MFLVGATAEPSHALLLGRRSIGWRAALLVLLAALLGGCADIVADYRYRITVYVATPEGARQFSSVRRVRAVEVATIQSSTGLRIDYHLKGQAVILDLPGGPVFALLGRPGDPGQAKGIAGTALGPRMPSKDTKDQRRNLRAMMQVKGEHDLPRTVRDGIGRTVDTWPMFVRFSNPDDPSSVKEVSAESIGVRRITVELTEEPVSSGIVDLLPWLPSVEGVLVQPPPGTSVADSTLPQSITKADFLMD